MDARIEGFNPFPMPTPRQQRQRQDERNFYLPRGGADADAEAEDTAGAEDHTVLEPMPPRASSDKPVSRTRLSDELGHRIDVRG